MILRKKRYLMRLFCRFALSFRERISCDVSSLKDAIVWSIKQFNGSQEYLMRAHFGLPSISAEDAREWKAPIQVRVCIAQHKSGPCLPETKTLLAFEAKKQTLF